MKRLICLLVIALMISSIAFAETIVLKSGKTIEGKIIEKTDEYIKLDVDGVTVTYYPQEVEEIYGGRYSVHAVENMDEFVSKTYKETAEKYNGPMEVILKTGIKFKPDEVSVLEDGSILLMFKGDSEASGYDYEKVLAITIPEVESINKVPVGIYFDEIARKKCKIYSKDYAERFEEGEQIAICPNYITYTHALYNFRVVMPVNWSEIYVPTRKPEELGKIISIAFGLEDRSLTMFHFLMKESKNINIDERLKEYMDSIKTVEGFVLDSTSSGVLVDNKEAVKVTYSSLKSPKIICYTFLNDGLAYELSLSCDSLNTCNRYSEDFEKILKTVTIEK